MVSGLVRGPGSDGGQGWWRPGLVAARAGGGHDVAALPPVGYQSGRLCVELAELRAEVRADGLHDLLHSFHVLHGEYLMLVLGDETK
jgi:hypothetical protein